MTPEERAERLISTMFFERHSEWIAVEHGGISIDAPPIVSAISTAIILAVAEEREACALACDAIATDKHDQYKGRGHHAPNNDHRADTYTEGESAGAELCAEAIRARGKVAGE